MQWLFGGRRRGPGVPRLLYAVGCFVAEKELGGHSENALEEGERERILVGLYSFFMTPVAPVFRS